MYILICTTHARTHWKWLDFSAHATRGWSILMEFGGGLLGPRIYFRLVGQHLGRNTTWIHTVVEMFYRKYFQRLFPVDLARILCRLLAKFFQLNLRLLMNFFMDSKASLVVLFLLLFSFYGYIRTRTDIYAYTKNIFLLWRWWAQTYECDLALLMDWIWFACYHLLKITFNW